MEDPAPGPETRWNGRNRARRPERRWANSWSPEQIANRLPVEFPDDESMRISHEAIYQALYVQGRGALKRELVACLRTGRALRVPRARARQRRDMVTRGDDQRPPRRSRRPRCLQENRSATGFPAPATAGSTTSCISRPSSSCATTPRAAPTTDGNSRRARPRWKRCDALKRRGTGPGGHCGATQESSAVDPPPARRHFGSATSRTRRVDATPTPQPRNPDSDRTLEPIP
jgi:hypothetical protein